MAATQPRSVPVAESVSISTANPDYVTITATMLTYSDGNALTVSGPCWNRGQAEALKQAIEGARWDGKGMPSKEGR